MCEEYKACHQVSEREGSQQRQQVPLAQCALAHCASTAMFVHLLPRFLGVYTTGDSVIPWRREFREAMVVLS